jgi:NAD-dependent SIR2 family protein deacetylase
MNGGIVTQNVDECHHEAVNVLNRIQTEYDMVMSTSASRSSASSSSSSASSSSASSSMAWAVESSGGGGGGVGGMPVYRSYAHGRIVQVHGSLERAVCTEPGCVHWISVYAHLNTEDWQRRGQLPRCPAHHSVVLKPDVVLFGQMVSKRLLDKAVAMIQDPQATALLVVGTAADVVPTADLVHLARQRPNMEIFDLNPLASHLTVKGLAHACVLGRAEEVLPVIVAEAMATTTNV